MCKVFKFLFKLIRILAVAVGALFVVYFWNLDQKLLGWAPKACRLRFLHSR